MTGLTPPGVKHIMGVLRRPKSGGRSSRLREG